MASQTRRDEPPYGSNGSASGCSKSVQHQLAVNGTPSVAGGAHGADLGARGDGTDDVERRQMGPEELVALGVIEVEADATEARAAGTDHAVDRSDDRCAVGRHHVDALVAAAAGPGEAPRVHELRTGRRAVDGRGRRRRRGRGQRAGDRAGAPGSGGDDVADRDEPVAVQRRRRLLGIRDEVRLLGVGGARAGEEERGGEQCGADGRDEAHSGRDAASRGRRHSALRNHDEHVTSSLWSETFVTRPRHQTADRSVHPRPGRAAPPPERGCVGVFGAPQRAGFVLRVS